jgi:hypothetical protein
MLSNVTLGSISWGTCRTCDLIDVFYHNLKAYAPDRAASLLSECGDDIAWACRESREVIMRDVPDNADHLLDALFIELDNLAPAGHYFGANEGDGSDYGFWAVTSD